MHDGSLSTALRRRLELGSSCGPGADAVRAEPGVVTSRGAALVTGAGGEIGGATARVLARSGYKVWLGHRGSPEAAQRTLRRVLDEGGAGDVVLLDVTDARACDDAVARIRETDGGVAAIVHAAGLAQRKLLLQTPESELDQIVDTNLTSFLRICRSGLRAMIARRGGSIVAVGSVAGRAGLEGQSGYCASKAGLGGAVRAIAREVGGYGIRVNLVEPGWIEGGMNRGAVADGVVHRIALRRAGTADEVASVVAFLCSDAASYVTGATVTVSGGLDP